MQTYKVKHVALKKIKKKVGGVAYILEVAGGIGSLMSIPVCPFLSNIVVYVPHNLPLNFILFTRITYAAKLCLIFLIPELYCL